MGTRFRGSDKIQFCISIDDLCVEGVLVKQMRSRDLTRLGSVGTRLRKTDKGCLSEDS